MVDEEMKRWFSKLDKGGTINANMSLKRFGYFSDGVKWFPKGLFNLCKGDLKAIQYLVRVVIYRLRSQNYALQYIRGLLTTVNFWQSFNYIKPVRGFKVANASSTPGLEEGRVLTQEGLRDILNIGDLKMRDKIHRLASSGLRLENLGYFRGEEDLRVKGSPEMGVGIWKCAKLRWPTIVVVNSTISKVRHRYFTLLIQQGCNYFKMHSEDKIARGEKL